MKQLGGNLEIQMKPNFRSRGKISNCVANVDHYAHICFLQLAWSKVGKQATRRDLIDGRFFSVFLITTLQQQRGLIYFV